MYIYYKPPKVRKEPLYTQKLYDELVYMLLFKKIYKQYRGGEGIEYRLKYATTTQKKIWLRKEICEKN